jgi:protoporphyrinogen oxidase
MCTDQEIMADIKTIFNEFVPEDVDHIENTYWEKALPIYDLQRYLSIKKLHQITRNEEESLAIFGNFVAGISLREMISAARTFAKNPTEYKEM